MTETQKASVQVREDGSTWVEYDDWIKIDRELSEVRAELAQAEVKLLRYTGLSESGESLGGELEEREARMEAEARSKEWANLCIAMLHELRMDYAPGVLGDKQGVYAIVRLRAQRDVAEAKLKQAQAALEQIHDSFDGYCEHHVGVSRIAYEMDGIAQEAIRALPIEE